MYEEWRELELGEPPHSVLSRFSPATAKQVAASLIKELSVNINTSSSSLDHIPPPPNKTLSTDEEIQWVMQVGCFGLSLSFSGDYETVRECVRLYSAWLTCVLPQPQQSIPRPLIEQPAKYAREIISHFRHLFVPRWENKDQLTLHQAKEAHYVLRLIQSLIIQSRPEVQQELWPTVLQFLLSINDSLLSIPFETDDITVLLCPRVISVLFELWLHACTHGHFPSPSAWKTFQNLAQHWRHRVPLVDQWVKATLTLTHRVILHLYGKNFCRISLSDEQKSVVPEDCAAESVQQAWYRIIHLLGNPTLIAKTSLYDNSHKFREHLARQGSLLEPSEHPCLSQLPYSFYRALSGIRLMVEAFLGEAVSGSFPGPEKVVKDWSDIIASAAHPALQPHSSAPPTSAPSALLKTALGLPAPSSKPSKDSASSSKQQQYSPHKSPNPSQLPASTLVYACLKGRPLKLNANGTPVPVPAAKIDQILDLFGEWLYDSAVLPLHMIALPMEDTTSIKSSGSMSEGESSAMSKSTSQTDVGPNRPSSHYHLSDLLGVSGIIAGKGEAVASLCKIFSTPSKDPISELHLIRFYSVIVETLKKRETIPLANLIFFGRNLFRMDLRGIEMLVPSFLDAIEHVVFESGKTRMHPSISESDLRGACLEICASLIALPTHFGTSAINDLNRNTEQHTFIGMRPKLLRTLLHSLNTETDSRNLQTSLYVASIFCHESAVWESRGDQVHSEGYCSEAVRQVVWTMCKQLVERWHGDNAVCVAALDALSSLAALAHASPVSSPKLGVQVIASTCSLVSTQLSKPPPAHSRDLHSTIVSALMALQTWMTTLPTLLQIPAALKNITDTIELGISGSKDQIYHEGNIGKKPASQRVHDAAEQLLYSLFASTSGYLWDKNKIETEDELLKHVGIKKGDDSEFRHYLLDNQTIVSMLELTNRIPDNSGFPCVAALIRSPYSGTRCWEFVLRPRNPSEPRPPDWVNRPMGVDPKPKKYPTPSFFPPEVEKIPKCKADLSRPTIHLTADAEKLIPVLKKLREPRVVSESPPPDIRPPPPAVACNIGRVLLHDFGFLNFEKNKNDCRILDGSSEEFQNEIRGFVDSCPSRGFQTIHLFYVKAGQFEASAILQNSLKLSETSSGFCRLVAGLGRGVPLEEHEYWTGHWSTYSRDPNYRSGERIKNDEFKKVSDEIVLDGLDHILFWATSSVEAVFLLPSPRSASLTPPSQSRAQSNPLFNDQPASPKHPKWEIFDEEAEKIAPQDTARRLSFMSQSTESLIMKTGGFGQSFPGARLTPDSDVMEGRDRGRSADDSTLPQSSVKIRNPASSSDIQRDAMGELELTSMSSRDLSTITRERASTGLPRPTSEILGPSASIERESAPGGRFSMSVGSRDFRSSVSHPPLPPGEKKGRGLFAALRRRPRTEAHETNPRKVATPPISLSIHEEMDSFGAPAWGRMAASDTNGAPVRPPRSKSVSSPQDPDAGKAVPEEGSRPPRRQQPLYQDYRILIVWLEDFDDHPTFPTKALLPMTDTGSEAKASAEATFTLFLAPLESGLCRVHLSGPWGKLGFAGPLVDGSVVSETVLRIAIQQTVVSIGRRRLLEQERCVLPHIQRRQRIQEFGNKWAKSISPAEFLQEILEHP